ncbi:MAG: GGDEF domain-containing protein [Deltaproteobacteria bacterium]|nr:GGDEF domain-containing protein [Deltaproteobacteria bacterium]
MIDASRALSVLMALTRTLAHERCLETALRAVTDAALILLPADHTSVRVLDDSERELLAGARSGAGAAERPVSFQPNVGVAGWAVSHGEVARVDDCASDPRFVVAPGQGFSIGSILCVPLFVSGKVVGVLSASSAQTGAFDEEAETFARLLANCAVTPIDRARLERIAVTDAHTLAFNRHYLLPRLREELERARQTVTAPSVLLMDLDNFKQVNDTYLHQAGDIVLRVFADRVRQAVRRHDVLVRRGGDEFVLILPATGRVPAEVVAQRIVRSMRDESIDVGAAEVAQTVSIGVATWDGHELAETLEARADEALYAAKDAGKGRVMLAPTLAPSPPQEEK